MTEWHPDYNTPRLVWYRDTAERVCTPKQLEVLRLASHKLSDRKIARLLHVRRETIRDHRQLAYLRIAQAKRHQEPAA